MSEIEFTETSSAQIDDIPAELPVLPLKETLVEVLFPAASATVTVML